MQLGTQPRSYPRVCRQNLRIPHDTECRSVAFRKWPSKVPAKAAPSIRDHRKCLQGLSRSIQPTNPQPGSGFWGSSKTVCPHFWTTPHRGDGYILLPFAPTSPRYLTLASWLPPPWTLVSLPTPLHQPPVTSSATVINDTQHPLTYQHCLPQPHRPFFPL